MHVTKDEAKAKIQALIERYNQAVLSDESKKDEANTKKDFIRPLFEALGWDFINDVTEEEKVSRKRVDYAFRIGGIPKFFVEAKASRDELDGYRVIDGEEITYSKQAVSYAWYKAVTWAVLTNFKEIRVLNAEVKDINNEFFALTCDKFIEKFDQLWLLSRESLESGLLDKEAENWGKKRKKISIDEQLLSDFTRFRELLTKNIANLNVEKNLTEEDLDEVVQRILDRLIFIRNVEDRELEQKVLISNLREWEDRGEGKRNGLYEFIIKTFVKFREQYNSGLFGEKDKPPHLCESVRIDNPVLCEVIEGLYWTEDKTRSYDFSAIEADVLGNIYEQYLGHILKKTKKRAKIKENHVHKKEQGIYYTPTYIVDYIVRNTLGELLKNEKTDVEKIRVLDPACGSGSFLIKAFDVLNEYYSKKEGYSQTQLDATGIPYTKKVKILTDNIHGVDLDKQAVEIAQLNLLLRITEKGQKLPLLQKNIRRGNSLIDDPEVAGDDAFKWEEKFKQIMDEGGFDVVVGNPPYFNLQTIKDESQNNHFKSRYKSYRGKADVLYLFIEKINSLLKKDGYLGFIVASYFLKSHYADKLREFILQNYEIIKIVDFGSTKIFGDANVDTCILILRKSNKKEKFLYALLKNQSNITDFLNGTLRSKPMENINYKVLFRNQSKIGKSPWHLEKEKIADTNPLSEVCNIGKGAATGKDDIFVIDKKVAKELKLESELLDELVEDSCIDRYRFKMSEKVLIRTERGANISNHPQIKKYLESRRAELQKRYAVQREGVKWFEIVRYNEDLFSPKVKEQIYAYYRSPHNKFAYSNKKFVTLTTTFVLTSKDKYKVSLKYLLGILNSKFIENYSRKNAKKMGGCFEYSSNFIGSIPIKIVPESQQQAIIKLVDKMLSLNHRLTELGDKRTDERARIEEEIKKTDAEIDGLVYEIYGITEEEIKIVEDSLK